MQVVGSVEVDYFVVCFQSYRKNFGKVFMISFFRFENIQVVPEHRYVLYSLNLAKKIRYFLLVRLKLTVFEKDLIEYHGSHFHLNVLISKLNKSIHCTVQSSCVNY